MEFNTRILIVSSPTPQLTLDVLRPVISSLPFAMSRLEARIASDRSEERNVHDHSYRRARKRGRIGHARFGRRQVLPFFNSPSK
jgi:hypothetical protein